MMLDETPGLERLDAQDTSAFTKGASLGLTDAAEIWSRASPVNRGRSEHGISDAMSSLQNDLNSKIEAAGEGKLPLLPYVFGQDRSLQEPGDMYDYMAAYLNNVGEASDADKALGKRYVDEYDRKVNALNAKRPDLKIPTVSQQFEEAKSRYKAALELWDDTSLSVGGGVVSFAAGAATDFNLFLNPKLAVANVATGAVSVPGGLAARAAASGAGNAVAGLVSNLTGRARERVLWGVEGEMGAKEMAVQAAEDFAGGAVFHVGAEVLGKLAKPLFGKVRDRLRPGEEPPPGLTPEAETELRADRDAQAFREANPDVNMRTTGEAHLAKAMASDGAMAPRIKEDLAALEKGMEVEEYGPPSPASYEGDIDLSARSIDPETFRSYDLVLEEQAKVRLDLDLERQAEYERRVNGEPSDVTKANMQEKRDYIQFLDEKARDLAPLIGRAYARARREWAPSAKTKSVVDDMVARGSKTVDRDALDAPIEIGGRAANSVTEERERVVRERGNPSSEDTKARAAARALHKLADEEDAALEKGIENLAGKQGGSVEGDAGTGTGGLPFDMEQKIIAGVDEDGNPIETSLREFFEESVDDLKVERAVSTCQMRS